MEGVNMADVKTQSCLKYRPLQLNIKMKEMNFLKMEIMIWHYQNMQEFLHS